MTKPEQKKLDTVGTVYDRVMDEPTPEEQNRAAHSLLEFMLGWNAHMAYMERQWTVLQVGEDEGMLNILLTRKKGKMIR